MTRRYAIPFRAEFVKPILSGRKTVTRRFRPRHVGTHLRVKVPNGKKRPSEWPGYANIVVTSCESWLLQQMDSSEIYREGLDSIEEFKSLWNEIYAGRIGQRWEDNPAVWRIEFKLEPSKGPAKRVSAE